MEGYLAQKNWLLKLQSVPEMAVRLIYSKFY